MAWSNKKKLDLVYCDLAEGASYSDACRNLLLPLTKFHTVTTDKSRADEKSDAIGYITNDEEALIVQWCNTMAEIGREVNSVSLQIVFGRIVQADPTRYQFEGGVPSPLWVKGFVKKHELLVKTSFMFEKSSEPLTLKEIQDFDEQLQFLKDEFYGEEVTGDLPQTYNSSSEENSSPIKFTKQLKNSVEAPSAPQPKNNRVSGTKGNLVTTAQKPSTCATTSVPPVKCKMITIPEILSSRAPSSVNVSSSTYAMPLTCTTAKTSSTCPPPLTYILSSNPVPPVKCTLISMPEVISSRAPSLACVSSSTSSRPLTSTSVIAPKTSTYCAPSSGSVSSSTSAVPFIFVPSSTRAPPSTATPSSKCKVSLLRLPNPPQTSSIQYLPSATQSLSSKHAPSSTRVFFVSGPPPTASSSPSSSIVSPPSNPVNRQVKKRKTDKTSTSDKEVAKPLNQTQEELFTESVGKQILAILAKTEKKKQYKVKIQILEFMDSLYSPNE